MPPISPKPFIKPAKTDWKQRIFFWVFVIFGIGAIALIIHKMPKQKALVCTSDVAPSLHSFGTCQEEE